MDSDQPDTIVTNGHSTATNGNYHEQSPPPTIEEPTNDPVRRWSPIVSRLTMMFFLLLFKQMTDIGDVIDGREIQVLETPEDIQARREQVLARFAHFKEAAKYRRDKLEDSREYQYFKRDADELEMWINEKIQICSQDDTYRDSTSVLVNTMLIASRARCSLLLLGEDSETRSIRRRSPCASQCCGSSRRTRSGKDPRWSFRFGSHPSK